MVLTPIPALQYDCTVYGIVKARAFTSSRFILYIKPEALCKGLLDVICNLYHDDIDCVPRMIRELCILSVIFVMYEALTRGLFFKGRANAFHVCLSVFVCCVEDFRDFIRAYSIVHNRIEQQL